ISPAFGPIYSHFPSGARRYMTIKPSCLLFSFLLVFCAASTWAINNNPLSEFDATGQWRLVESIAASGSKNEFVVTEGTGKIILNTAGEAELSTKSGFGDTWVKMEFMVAEDTEAAIYLQSRYGIAITNSKNKKSLVAEDMGGLLNRVVDGKKIDGVAASKNAAKQVGEWQQLEIRFRAPRYDLANNKVDNAFFLDIKLNDQLVQQNIIAKGFVAGSKYPWEER